jgi:hypothetical protein
VSPRTRTPTREAETSRGNGAQVMEAPPEVARPPTEEEIEVQQADLEAEVEAAVEAAYQEALSAPSVEIAEPELWWDIAGYGPLQFTAPGAPLLPHQVIKVGEPAFVFALVLLNPFLPLSGGTNAADVLANFALPFEIRYQAGNLTTWSLGQPDMQSVHNGNLVPHQFFYVDVLRFIGRQPGLYELNISARILGAAPPHVNAPQFAAYATTVFSLDRDGLFGRRPPGPMRFQIYEA